MDLVDEARDYHLMPERRSLLQSFRTKPRRCKDVAGVIYAVGGQTKVSNYIIGDIINKPHVCRMQIAEGFFFCFQINLYFTKFSFIQPKHTSPNRRIAFLYRVRNHRSV